MLQAGAEQVVLLEDAAIARVARKMRRQRRFDLGPRQPAGEHRQGVAQVDHLGQAGAEEVGVSTISGIGIIGALAIVASVGEFKQFKNGAQFSAWLGMVPRQNSSGGKVSLGCITKRGDDYLRTLLIQGARSAVMTAHKRTDRISLWVVRLRERVGWQKAAVALGNKNAQILWAILTKGVRFDADHESVKPVVPSPVG